MAIDPDEILGKNVGDAKIRGATGPNTVDQTSTKYGPNFYALNLARVTSVNYEDHEVDLLIETGEIIPKVGVALTQPGAGHRHFFGSMPMEGDVCVVGYGMQESGRTRQPFVLSWVIPGTTAGYDWMPTQPFSPDEFGLSPKLKEQFRGLTGRVRHKLRHMEPGNIMASSAQGADFVLNESVLLANRRGNEIRLRDQDQALVVRSLQQFHAGAGFRMYSGMVQRDATFLPSQMFSDGIDWNAPQQENEEGELLGEDDLAEALYTSGYLTPARVFEKDEEGIAVATTTEDAKLGFAWMNDPFDFLRNGLFITEDGYAREDTSSDAIYGGKQMYRVSTSVDTNGVVDTFADTFTEVRFEVSHTSDGTLPVTEQTDGFDADRLPGSPQEDPDPLGGSINAPYIQWVMGTVVGNDPFSKTGRNVYGKPLLANVFNGEERAPGLSSGIGTPVERHAATLFQIYPLTVGGDPTFWTVTKDGRVLMSLVGPEKAWSAEVALAHGLKLGAGVTETGESVYADCDGAFVLRSRQGRNADNLGVFISSEGGAVKIYGAGTSQVGGISARTAGAGDGEGGLPAVIIESGTNTLIKANKTLTLSANALRFENIKSMAFGASTGLDLQSGGGISTSSDTLTQTSTGKHVTLAAGPKGGNPANGAVVEFTSGANPATGFFGGPVDKALWLYGDRLETQGPGNHTSTMAVGNRLHTVGAGAHTTIAQGATMGLSAAGLSGVAATGNVAFGAPAGAASITASANASMTGATAGMNSPVLSLRNLPGGIHTPPPGNAATGGGVITDQTIDPITGTTLLLSGTLGIPTVRVF